MSMISKSAPVSDPEFDIDQVKGKVVTSEKVKIPTLQTVVVKGLTTVTGHQKVCPCVSGTFTQVYKYIYSWKYL